MVEISKKELVRQGITFKNGTYFVATDVTGDGVDHGGFPTKPYQVVLDWGFLHLDLYETTVGGHRVSYHGFTYDNTKVIPDSIDTYFFNSPLRVVRVVKDIFSYIEKNRIKVRDDVVDSISRRNLKEMAESLHIPLYDVGVSNFVHSLFPDTYRKHRAEVMALKPQEFASKWTYKNPLPHRFKGHVCDHHIGL